MYILVTRWEGFWRSTDRKSTHYPTRLVRTPGRALNSGTSAIFIKIDEAGRVEAGWRGTVQDIQAGAEETYFTPVLGAEILPLELSRFEGLKPGWYEDPTAETKGAPSQEQGLFPPFIRELDSTSDGTAFEDSVYKLLRLLGIHRAYRFPPDRQAGRADGFFRILNLAVIWDSTLLTDFQARKGQQIQNYCNQLLQGQVEVSPDTVERVADLQRHVWIVTRGRSRVLRKVRDVGNVVVKEIAVADLKMLYLDRLQTPLTEEEVENRLRNLG